MQKESWLYSDSFLKRAFAIWGHYFVANLIIGAGVFVFALLLAAIFGLNLARELQKMETEGSSSTQTEENQPSTTHMELDLQ